MPEKDSNSFINDNSSLISQRESRAEMLMNCCHTGGIGDFVPLSQVLHVMSMTSAEHPRSLAGGSSSWAEILVCGLWSHKPDWHTSSLLSRLFSKRNKQKFLSTCIGDTWSLWLDCRCPSNLVTGPSYKNGLGVVCCAWSFREYDKSRTWLMRTRFTGYCFMSS